MSATRLQSRHARLQTALRRLLCAGALLPLFALIHTAAYLLRLDGQFQTALANHLVASLLLTLAIKTPVFASFRLFRGWLRFLTFQDLLTLAKAATISTLLLIALFHIALPQGAAPRSVLLLDWALTILILGGVRSLVRVIQEYGFGKLLAGGPHVPVLIAGADNSGEALLRAIRRDSQSPYRVVGFVSDDARMTGSQIGGVPVVTNLAMACEYAHLNAITEILITADALNGRQLRGLVDSGRERGVSVKVLPSLQQLLSGRVHLRPRAVSTADLLRRDPVQLDLDGLHQWIEGRVILVTGSAGSIGSEICRQLLSFSPRKLIAVDRSENGQFFLQRELETLAPDIQVEICLADVLDGLRLSSIFREHAPDIVFHAAAYKHVPLMEAHPGEAVKNICVATRLVADLANQYGVNSFVLISTDKAVEPSSMMGACKRVAELYVQSLSVASKSRFVTVTHPEMRRFFMTIPEASQLVIQAGAIGLGGEIFVLDMGEPVRITDLAGDMIRHSGLTPGRDIEIEFVGMRPGEKLVEELHFHDEQRLPTIHPKIMVAEGRRCDPHHIRRSLNQLAELASVSPDEVRDHLAAMLPEFRSPAGAAPLDRVAQPDRERREVLRRSA